MTKIITLAAAKGGAGKTTIAFCLTAQWHMVGKSVLLVDLDPQGSSRDLTNLAEREGYEPPECLFIGEQSWQEAVEKHATKREYDLIVIDSPGRHALVSAEAIAAADVVLVPITSSNLDLWANERTLRLAKETQIRDKNELKIRTVITRFKKSRKLSKTLRPALEVGGFPACEAVIRDLAAYEAMTNTGAAPTVLERSKKRPSKTVRDAADEVRALAGELEEMLGIQNSAVEPFIHLAAVGA